MRTNELIREYWQLFGIEKEDCNRIAACLNDLTLAAINVLNTSAGYKSISQQKQENLEFISQIRKKYGLEDYGAHLPGEGRRVTLPEGLEEITAQMKKRGAVVGIQGAPGSGKTTLIHEIQKSGVYCLDEFWDESNEDSNRETYEKKNGILTRRKRKEESTVIAAGVLDFRDVDFLAQMELPPGTRTTNLRRRFVTRGNTTDLLRAQHYDDIFQHVDFFRYQLPRIRVDIVIDSTVSY